MINTMAKSRDNSYVDGHWEQTAGDAIDVVNPATDVSVERIPVSPAQLLERRRSLAIRPASSADHEGPLSGGESGRRQFTHWMRPFPVVLSAHCRPSAYRACD